MKQVSVGTALEAGNSQLRNSQRPRRTIWELPAAAKFGVDWLTASYLIVTGDHIGTHIDSLRHLRDNAPGPEGIPLDYCYGDGVCLDFRHLEKGAGISVDDMKAALAKIKYTLKPLDIVLIHTGAGAIQESE